MTTPTVDIEGELRSLLESYYTLLGMLDSIVRHLPEGDPEAFLLSSVVEGGIPETVAELKRLLAVYGDDEIDPQRVGQLFGRGAQVIDELRKFNEARRV